MAVVSWLLGVAVFILQVSAAEEPQKVMVTVWPAGSTVYVGEPVLLRCTVESNSTSEWTYRWHRDKPHIAPTSNPRHLVSGDSYSITVVTREDAGSYRCRAEPRERNATATAVSSRPAVLSVSELTPPSLTLTPSCSQMFRGQSFSVQCPSSQTDSTAWRLRHVSPGPTETTAPPTEPCSPPGGGLSTNKSNMCVFIAISGTSGLYWCEGAEGRSSAVNITVSDGDIILRTPPLPVSEGDTMVLTCQSRTGHHGNMTFFKNGQERVTSGPSLSDTVTELVIKKVTQEDEGFYRCVSQDRRTESPGGWVSVRPRPGSLPPPEGAAASTGGSWRWVLVSCLVLVLVLVLVPPSVWLLHHLRPQTFCCRTCRPRSDLHDPAAPLPATKQDVTEVQWDLSWMEMSTLLDKNFYPGS